REMRLAPGQRRLRSREWQASAAQSGGGGSRLLLLTLSGGTFYRSCFRPAIPGSLWLPCAKNAWNGKMPAHDFRSPRLFVDTPLAAGAAVALDRDQSNYLGNVLRLAAGCPGVVF